ncbi:hypothetical protein EA187_12990 [Lujinxingia sediminis]|uniref:Alginate export domain-containing protein n=1 Tax=Lujinxingia sediminis TaxID=2480984 RepID=A0ABY0CRC9_9DELT|nr:hypothetical protein [Lujinxingia sediminis]RVU43124.1 hypothetical protein EA187_12990 [Lujinxingia sediminis]
MPPIEGPPDASAEPEASANSTIRETDEARIDTGDGSTSEALKRRTTLPEKPWRAGDNLRWGSAPRLALYALATTPGGAELSERALLVDAHLDLPNAIGVGSSLPIARRALRLPNGGNQRLAGVQRSPTLRLVPAATLQTVAGLAITLALPLRHEWATRTAGNTLPLTGGTLLSIEPRLRWSLTDRLHLLGGVSLPAIQALRGDAREGVSAFAAVQFLPLF